MIWLNREHIKIDDSETIWLPVKLDSLLELENMVIVVMLSDDLEEMKKVGVRNVFAYNRKGKQLWQIQEQEQIVNGRKHVYDSVYIGKDKKVMVGGNWGGEYYLNVEDGTVTPAGGRPW